MKPISSKFSRFRKPLVFFLTLCALVYVSARTTRVSVQELSEGYGYGYQLLKTFFPPDWSAMPRMLEASLTTLAMALLATPLGALISFGFGLLAAKNTSWPGVRRVARILISTERALPEVVVLLFLAAALGLGLYPGILALAIGSIGMLGRLLADAIEEIDERVMESVSVTGATRWQMIRYAILPEVLPSFVANAVFRFEINLRNSVLLGAVGVGGIGYELNEAISLMNYERATTAILVIVVLVFLSERCSDSIRKSIEKQGEMLR